MALLFLAQLLLAGAILLPLAIDLPDAQRTWLRALLLQRGALWIALALLLLLGLGIGLKALFDAYLTPVARLAEDAVLLAANPGHRIAPQGARDVRVLVDKLNLLAASHQAVHDDVQARIALANRALAEEKNRLAALMAELALSVLVCNIEGRILLYNDSARQLLEAGGAGAPVAGAAAIGLGRSVFGVIERGLILHALEQLQHQLREGGAGAARPVSGFVATLSQGQIVRAHMAPVFDNVHTLNGFVLTLEDITRNVEADNRRDALLQSLTQDARATLANLLAAVETIQAFPDMNAGKRSPAYRHHRRRIAAPGGPDRPRRGSARRRDGQSSGAGRDAGRRPARAAAAADRQPVAQRSRQRCGRCHAVAQGGQLCFDPGAGLSGAAARHRSRRYRVALRPVPCRAAGLSRPHLAWRPPPPIGCGLGKTRHCKPARRCR
ncbi:hypothetical protein ACU4GD_11205 [Cupriavidus basilensis]